MATLPENSACNEDFILALMARKTPAERTILASRMFDSAREMLRGYLRQQHPEWPERQVAEELLRRIHGSA
jgi:hypothetical protein